MARPRSSTPEPAATPAAVATTADQYTPAVSQRGPDSAPPPRLPPGPDFMLKAHPERWTVIAGAVVPQLAKLLIQPGVNGILRDRAGRPILDEVLLDQRRNRWTVIPWDVDGPGTSYLRKPAGTEARLLRWERCFPGSEQVVPDERGYAAWCLSLVERGVVAAPLPHVLERMIATRRAEIEQLEAQPGGAHRRGLLLAEIEVIEKRLAQALAGATPADTEAVHA